MIEIHRDMVEMASAIHTRAGLQLCDQVCAALKATTLLPREDLALMLVIGPFLGLPITLNVRGAPSFATDPDTVPTVELQAVSHPFVLAKGSQRPCQPAFWAF